MGIKSPYCTQFYSSLQTVLRKKHAATHTIHRNYHAITHRRRNLHDPAKQNRNRKKKKNPFFVLFQTEGLIILFAIQTSNPSIDQSYTPSCTFYPYRYFISYLQSYQNKTQPWMNLHQVRNLAYAKWDVASL
jgi:hypothetical protein